MKKNAGKAALALSRARAIAREHKDEAEIEMGNLGAAGMIGLLERTGAMNNIPQLFGLPRTVIVAVLMRVASKKMGGSGANMLRGMSSGAAAVAIYQFAKGVQVSGLVGDSDVAGLIGAPSSESVRAAAGELERALQRAEAHG